MFKLPIDFGKKKSSHNVSATERVQTLSEQGYSDPEIVRTLRTEGYSPSEAEGAMKSAVKGAAIPGSMPQSSPQQQPQPMKNDMGSGPNEFPSLDTNDLPPPPQSAAQPQPRQEFQPRPHQPPAEQPYDQPSSDFFPKDIEKPEMPSMQDDMYGPAALPEVPGINEHPRDFQSSPDQLIQPVGRRTDIEKRGDIEEITEGLIEEKWSMFERELDDIHSKIDHLTKKIQSLEVTMSEFKGVKRDDIQQIKSSINSYGESMSDVSSKIEAMERAVKDSLTPMMQSMRSLTDTLKVVKTRKRSPTSEVASATE